MVPPDVFLHRQETRRLHYRCRRGVFPCPVCFPPRDLSRQLSRHLDLKPPQGRAHAVRDHPGPRSEDQHRLYHVLKKEAGHPRRRSLPAEYPQNPPTRSLCPGQDPHHRRLVFVCRQYHPP